MGVPPFSGNLHFMIYPNLITISIGEKDNLEMKQLDFGTLGHLKILDTASQNSAGSPQWHPGLGQG